MIASCTCSSAFSTAPSSISGPIVTPSPVPLPTTIWVDLLGEEPDEGVVDAALDVDAVRADARLACVAELGGNHAVDRLVEVGVVEDHVRGVATELEREALDLVGRATDEILPDLGRPGERELANARVGEERVGDHARRARRDEVHDSGWRARVFDRPEDGCSGERRCARRLDDARAARRHRRPQLARHHRGGEVPGRDRGGDPDRLSKHEDATSTDSSEERSGRRRALPRRANHSRKLAA